MRVKNGNVHALKRKKLLKRAKGFWGTRKSNYRKAKDTVKKALMYSTRDRKVRKREFRRLWITRISAALDGLGLNYSKFIDYLKKQNIILNRQILSNLAVEDFESFKTLVESVKK